MFNILPQTPPGPDRVKAVVPDVRRVRPGGGPHRRHPLLLPLQAQAPAQQVLRRREDGVPARTEGNVLVRTKYRVVAIKIPIQLVLL